MKREGEVKRGTPAILKDLVAVVNSVMRPASPQGYRMEDEFPHLLGVGNAENIYYIEEDGKPVSVIAVKIWKAFLADHMISVASLGSVSTLPEYRGKRYATIILDRIISDLEIRKVALLLVSGTRDLYKRAGCIQAGCVYSYSISRESLSAISKDGRYDVRKIARRDEAAGWVLDLYNKEHYRFSRDINLMKILLDATWFKRENWPMELFEISENGTKVAYFIGYKRGSEKRTMNVMEMAGSRSAIINSLSAILKELDADDILLRVHPTDTSLIETLDSMGFTRQVTHVQGTVRVIDPSTLLAELGSIVAEDGWHCSIDRKGDNFALQCDSLHAHIDARTPSDITDTFFGSGDRCMKIPLMFTDDLNFI
ncbi:MAG: GNAT family N-acetyltransferase [Thermoplasmata archaeon]